MASIYADGGVVDHNPSQIGGTWAYCHVDEHGWRAYEQGGFYPAAPGCPVTNNAMEFYALLQALESLPDGWSGRVCSDSRVTLGRFFEGWRMTGIPNDWWVRGALQHKRLWHLTPVHHDGHPTRAQLLAGVGKSGSPVSQHQVWCDQECARQARRARLLTPVH